MKNPEFRAKLKQMLDNETDDEIIIKEVLEFIWNDWSRPFFIWLFKKIEKYDYFKD